MKRIMALVLVVAMGFGCAGAGKGIERVQVQSTVADAESFFVGWRDWAFLMTDKGLQGYRVRVEKTGEGWKLISIDESLKLMRLKENQELLFVNHDLKFVQPAFFSNETQFIKYNGQLIHLPNAAQWSCATGIWAKNSKGYGPCNSKFTSVLVGESLLPMAFLGAGYKVNLDKATVIQAVKEAGVLEAVRAYKAKKEAETKAKTETDKEVK